MKEIKNKGGAEIYIVMGVSGSGKSTIAPLLARELCIPYFDGDDFHPEENVKKMSARMPLTDDDRHQWLVALNELAKRNVEKGAVIVCSALKESHRKKLSKGLESQMKWIFLQGSYDLIRSRLELRKGHFMPVSLLRSQFETLEIPREAITVSVDGTPEAIVKEVIAKLRKGKA